MIGDPTPRELGRCSPAVRAVGALLVVVDAPVLGEDLALVEVVEELLVAHPSVEGLDPGVLPRRPRLDEDRRGAIESALVGDGEGNELGTVVEAHVGRITGSSQ